MRPWEWEHDSRMDKRSPIVLFTGVQRLARELRPLGFLSACLKEPGEKIHNPDDLDFVIEYDPGTPELLEAWAKAWPERKRIVAVVNRREKRVLEHAILNRALGKNGLTVSQAIIMRDKLRLRLHLKEKAPKLNPSFVETDLKEGDPPPLPFPFVLKPRNFFKSQLLFPCEKEGDWTRALKEIPNLMGEAQVRHGVLLETTFLAEELLSGRHFSIDAFIERDGRIVFTPPVALSLGKDWSMDDMHVAVRLLPSEGDATQERLLMEAVAELVTALDLRESTLHVDLVLNDRGTYIVDAAPRIGGYRSEMMELAYGCSLDLLGLELALGKGISWRPRWSKAVAVLEVFPPFRGILRSIEGLESLKRLPSFRRLKCRTNPGEEVGLAREGFRCPLFVVLSDDDKRVVERDIQEVRRLLKMKVERK